MKKFILLPLLFFVTGVFSQTQHYRADTARSVIYWKGFKPGGSQNGTLALKSGYLTVKDGRVKGGSFVIDMNKMTCLSIPADNSSNKKLIAHLKSEDFFEVETYPYATFILTGYSKDTEKPHIKGNLSMKNKTNPVRFPAILLFDTDSAKIESETFKIDRSKWNIKYKSKSFFNELKDQFIYDDMEVRMVIYLKKA